MASENGSDWEYDPTPCPNCGTRNVVGAAACWNCMTPLIGPSGDRPPPGTPSASSQRSTPQPSQPAAPQPPVRSQPSVQATPVALPPKTPQAPPPAVSRSPFRIPTARASPRKTTRPLPVVALVVGGIILLTICWAAFHATSPSPPARSAAPASYQERPSDVCSTCSGSGTVSRTERVQLPPERYACEYCTDGFEPGVCKYCRGSGRIPGGPAPGSGTPGCAWCLGRGRVVCGNCDGAGYIEFSRWSEVNVPRTCVTCGGTGHR